MQPVGWSTDYTNRCGNCQQIFKNEGDYCACCGARKGEGEYEPYNEIFMNLFYGPPSISKWKCMKCDNSWQEWGHKQMKYCSICGAEGRLVTSKNDYDSIPYFSSMKKHHTEPNQEERE